MTVDIEPKAESQAHGLRAVAGRVELVEGKLDSISEALRVLMSRSEPKASESSKAQVGGGKASEKGMQGAPSKGADSAAKDQAIRSFFEEESESGSASPSEGGRDSLMLEKDLPALEGGHNDPYPDHLESLCEERSKAAYRNRWSMPEAFASSPLPTPLDPKVHRVDSIKGDRSKSELKELHSANAWLERALNQTARVCLADKLSKTQAQGYLKQLLVKIGAAHDITARRAGFLINQDQCGKHAARVMRDASGRARRPFSSHAEEQVLPLMRDEFLRAEIKALAAKKSGVSWAGSDDLLLKEESKGSRVSDQDRAKRNKERKLRRREREKSRKPYSDRGSKEGKTQGKGQEERATPAGANSTKKGKAPDASKKE